MSVISGIDLYDVVGSPASSDGIILFPACFDFEHGKAGRVECRFGKIQGAIESLKGCFENPDECEWLIDLWIRARLSAVFQYGTPVGWEDHLLNHPFLAIGRSRKSPCFSAIPFVCVADSNHGPGLVFRKREGGANKRRVATAFWNVLLREPRELSTYEVHVFHDSEGWIKLSCRRGQISEYEIGVDDERGLQFDQHFVWLPGGINACPACEGTGEKSFFPAGAPCETCCGFGYFR